MLKRIKKVTENNGILVCSDNLEYDSFELHKSQINAVALVTGVIRIE